MRTQTAAIVVAGLVVSNVAGYLLYAYDRRNTLLMTEAFDIAERVAGVSRLLRDVLPEWKSEVIQASDSRVFRVWSGDRPFVDRTRPSDDERKVEVYLRAQVPRISGNDIRVHLSERPMDASRVPLRLGADILRGEVPGPEIGGVWRLAISIDHGDGEWINFLGVFNTPSSHLPILLAFNLMTAVLAAALVAFWLVNRVLAPLGRFSRAAEQFGQDINAPAMDEHGSLEVESAARAFNDMRGRLVRLIEGRATMLAAISHDLRTPITQIRLRTETMWPEEERERCLATLDEMNAIIGTILDYGRATSVSEERSVVDIGSLVESLCDDFRETGLNVECEVAYGLLSECRRIAVKRAVSNVVRNAIAYGQLARVRVAAENGFVLISVEDNGPGIPSEQLDEVFVPFYRGESSRAKFIEGTGLGLSIALAIVEDHAGRLSLANLERGGLRSEIRLKRVGSEKGLAISSP